MLPKEELVARTLAQHHLRLDVDISSGHVGADRNYPYIKVTSWVKALDKHRKLEKLFGLGPQFDTLTKCGPTLLDFWAKFRALNPGHEVFTLADQGAFSLNAALPVVIHGDEGTTYKKDGCLVFSFHSIIGCGTISNKLGPVVDGDAVDPHTNFVGHAFQTRFLLGSLLRDSWHHICINGFMDSITTFFLLVCTSLHQCHTSDSIRKTTEMTTPHILSSCNWCCNRWMRLPEQVSS